MSKTKRSRQIFEYIYRRDVTRSVNTRVGILMAERAGDLVVLGWSRCNKAAGDQFDWRKGLQAAKKNVGKPLPISFSRRHETDHFRARAARYFKDAAIPAWQIV